MHNNVRTLKLVDNSATTTSQKFAEVACIVLKMVQ